MYDLHLERDRFGSDPAAAVGAVLEGAASVVNAITGAVTAGVSQQNEPQILTRNKSDLYATRLRQVRSLNTSLGKKKTKLKAKETEIRKLRRDSQTLKKSLEKKLRKLSKWPNLMTIKKGKYKGKYKDPATAQGYINRIKHIDRYGVMMTKLVRLNHLIHGPDQRNRLREQIEWNQNNKKREDLVAAWGYLTNISGFRPVLALDMSGYGMSVLNVLPANDNLIGKRALTTVYPAFLNSAESRSAAVGRVPIFQRSTTLQTMLTMFGEGYIGTGVWPEAWLLGLTAEELEALPSPGAPLGAIYDIAMEAFPNHYFAKRMVVQDGLSVPETSVSGDGYGAMPLGPRPPGWESNEEMMRAMGGRPQSAATIARRQAGWRALQAAQEQAAREGDYPGYGGWGEQGVSIMDMTWNWDDTHQVETSYDPFAGAYGDAFGAAPATAFMNRVLQSIRDGTAKRKIAENEAQAATTAPTPQEAVRQLPASQAPMVKAMVVMDLTRKGGSTAEVPKDPLAVAQKSTEPKPGLSVTAKAGIGVGVVALLGTGWYLFGRDE